MDIHQDEIRRHLRTARAEQRAAIGPWRHALTRVFGEEGRIPTSAKAELLGVPTRRGFLRIGGATILGAAVLAACGDTGDESGQGVSESGGIDGTTTTTDPDAAAVDITLLRTATSLEILAVNAYDTLLVDDLLGTAAVVEAAELFRDQHEDHAGALQAATEEVGGTPFTEPNAFVQETVIDPAVADLTNEDSAVELALMIETVAAETYVFAAGALAALPLRQAIMSIGGVEARHMAVLQGVLDDNPAAQVPVAFLPSITSEQGQDDTGLAIEDALVPGGDAGGDAGAEGDTTTSTTGDGAGTTTTGGETTTTAA